MTLLEWPDRAAGFLPADRLDVALTLSPQQGATFRNARVTGYGALAARAERIAAIRAFLAGSGFARPTRQAHAGRRLDARLRAAHARRRELHPDEFAAAAGRPAGARRQALQRDRASRRERDAVHRHGAGVARARPVGAGDLRRRPRRRPADPGRPRQRAGGRRRTAGAGRGALRSGGRSAGGAASRGRCPACCRSSRASITRCRATTWTRC